MNIDLSNPTIQGVVIGGLIGLVGLVVAAFAGYFGGKAGARIAAGAAREAARIAQQEAQADRDEPRMTRFSDRTRELVAQVLASARRYRRGVRNYVYYGAPDRLNLGDTFPEVIQELRLIARLPGTLEALDTFYDATLRLQDFEGQGPFNAEGRKQFDVFDGDHGRARIAFEAAIQAELGSGDRAP